MKDAKLLLTSFLLTSIFFFSNCSKDHDVTASTAEALIRSNWAVDYYFNSQDMTSNYGSYRILFSSSGLLVAQKNNETITGNWSDVVDVNNNEVVVLNFNTTDGNLIQLNKQWKLVNKNSATIEFENIEQINPSEILRIRKD